MIGCPRRRPVDQAWLFQGQALLSFVDPSLVQVSSYDLWAGLAATF